MRRRTHAALTLRGRGPRRKRPAFVLGLCLAAACVPVPVAETLPETTPTDVDGAFDLGVRLSDGSYLELADLRGHRVLLFVFATFDGASQASLRPIEMVKAARPDLRVVGIAAQPDARDLVDAWVHALEPSFPVGYDPTGELLAGESALGVLESVPLFVLIDPSGRPLLEHRGYMEPQQLERFVDGRAE